MIETTVAVSIMAEIALILGVFFHWKPVKCVCPKCTETVDPVVPCAQKKQPRCAQECPDSPLCVILIICVHVLLFFNTIYLIYKAITWVSERQPSVTVRMTKSRKSDDGLSDIDWIQASSLETRQLAAPSVQTAPAPAPSTVYYQPARATVSVPVPVSVPVSGLTPVPVGTTTVTPPSAATPTVPAPVSGPTPVPVGTVTPQIPPAPSAALPTVLTPTTDQDGG